MFGDFILWFIKGWKQFWCIHEYNTVFVCNGTYSYRQCKKCGKLASCFVPN